MHRLKIVVGDMDLIYIGGSSSMSRLDTAASMRSRASSSASSGGQLTIVVVAVAAASTLTACARPSVRKIYDGARALTHAYRRRQFRRSRTHSFRRCCRGQLQAKSFVLSGHLQLDSLARTRAHLASSSDGRRGALNDVDDDDDDDDDDVDDDDDDDDVGARAYSPKKRQQNARDNRCVERFFCCCCF